VIEEEEKKLFREFVGDVEPINQSGQRLKIPVDRNSPALVTRRMAAVKVTDSEDNFLAGEEHVPRVKPLDTLSFKRDGIQHGVFRRLKQGHYAVESSLDLHRLTVVQSRKEVLAFVRDCVAHDIRCGSITHGKGEQREDPALLKSCVNYWLPQLSEVLAFHTAPRHCGGLGVTFILFRKSPEKKAANRLRFTESKSSQ
jgi:DNA-nicking Smr family endonuclease